MSLIKFTKDHEWISVDGDIGTVGITDYAQHALGDIVFVELPALGREVTAGGEAAIVESVKAASEVYAPVGGEGVMPNPALQRPTGGIATGDPVGADRPNNVTSAPDDYFAALEGLRDKLKAEGLACQVKH